MLMQRLYEPSDGELVYHYCSALTFHAIANTRTIRFTDINMLNDEMEIHWGYHIFETAANRLIKRIDVSDSVPEVSITFIEAIDSIISPIQLYAHPFVSCFSRDGDHLGQWRAYADDGHGFAIGFKSRALKEFLPVTMLEVLYDPDEQVKEMMAAILAILDGGGVESSNAKTERFVEDCVLLATFMTAFKHPAFRDEKEVRAVHAVGLDTSSQFAKFLDSGGTIRETVEVPGVPVKFNVRDNHLVACIDIPITCDDGEIVMSELVLGPKNRSFEGNLLLFLGGLKYSGINFRRSHAPYR